jgi:RNA polymerase sigma-70 factor (ECF subfamily)
VPTSLSLLVRLCDRDRDAWRECLTLYTPLILRWCFRQGLSEHDAADVAQEVFRKVVEYLPRFRLSPEGGSFRGWLCRITYQEIAAHFRRAPLAVPAGGHDALLRLEQVPDRPIPGPDEDDALQETRYLYQKVLHVARAEFPDRMWQMFWRVAVDGNPAPQVAEELGATPAAVRQVKSRVLRRLKQLVGDLAD